MVDLGQFKHWYTNFGGIEFWGYLDQPLLAIKVPEGVYVGDRGVYIVYYEQF